MSADKFRYILTTMKFRLIIILIAILLPSFLVISIMNYRAARTTILESLVSTTMPLIRESFYKKLQLELRDPVLLSSLMANDTFLKDWVLEGEKDVDAVMNYLDAIRSKYGFSSSFFVSQLTDHYYTSSGILKSLSPSDDHDRWYYDFTGTGKEYALDVDTDQAAENRLTIFINYRVESEKKLLGVTGVGISMNHISSYLKEIKNRYGALVYLVDDKGTIQAHPNMETIEKGSLSEIPGLENSTSVILKKQETPLDLTYQSPKGQVLVTIQYIEDLDWFIIVEENRTEALHMARFTLSLNIAATVLISLLVIFLSVLVVNYFQSKLELLSSTDKLTGICNRRQLDLLLALEIKRASRYKRSLSVAMADLDDFKKVNDSLGHLQGDLALQKFAGLLEEKTRATDTPGRWGGEEFLIILPETDRKGAYLMAEQIRTVVDETDFLPVKKLTVSIGVAELEPDETAESLIGRADAALYAAKEAGKNRTVVSSPKPSSDDSGN